MEHRRPGRPTKLTPALINLLADLLAAGSFAQTAVATAGIAESTYYRWLKRGQSDLERGDDTIHAEFCRSIKGAEAHAEVEHLALLFSCERGWQRYAWWLERRFPRRWGRQRFREISGPDKGPVERDVRERVEAMLARKAVAIEDGRTTSDQGDDPRPARRPEVGAGVTT